MKFIIITTGIGFAIDCGIYYCYQYESVYPELLLPGNTCDLLKLVKFNQGTKTTQKRKLDRSLIFNHLPYM
jgi:hypothetical protein